LQNVCVLECLNVRLLGIIPQKRGPFIVTALESQIQHESPYYFIFTYFSINFHFNSLILIIHTSCSSLTFHNLYISFFIHQWLYSSLLGPGLFFTFVIFLIQPVGLLGRMINRSQGRCLHTEQHKHRINAHTDIHASSGIRTHDPSVRANEDSSCLRPRGHGDRHRMTLHRYFSIIGDLCCEY
jgi:hypothetical protein